MRYERIKDIFEFRMSDPEHLKDIIGSAIDQGYKKNWYLHASNEQTTSISRDNNKWLRLDILQNFVRKEYYNITKAECKVRTKDLWINIYRPGGIQNSHVHSFGDDNILATWVYFAEVPENSGNLIADGIQYGNEGTLLLFPSTLYHHVTKNKSQLTRITVAGNIIRC